MPNTNTPILSRSASDDKSDDYQDADDNTNTILDANKSKPSEGLNNPDSQGIPNQVIPQPTPINTSTPTAQNQIFQSTYVAESKHPT